MSYTDCKVYGLKDKIGFGKHKGLTIKEIIDRDPSYIEWALDNVDTFEVDDDAYDYYEMALEWYYAEGYRRHGVL